LVVDHYSKDRKSQLMVGLGLWCLTPLSIRMKVALNTVTLTSINVEYLVEKQRKQIL